MNSSAELPAAPDDPRLMRVVQEYLTELEAGRRPNRRDFIARTPDLADDLEPYLDALDAVHAAAPQLAPPESSSTPEFPAEPLGDFRIVREIGRGGMGVVYEAVQLSLGRRVALKVLPFAATLDSRQRQRFLNEAQAAAQLHHTNIVPVYAVGCERGLHFYAMQLIEGRSLDAVIRELRAESGRPELPTGETTMNGRAPKPPSSVVSATAGQRSNRDRESFRNAAKLMAQVADALDYAHNNGVVHRDIKPANLLLDAKGNIWVTDFGLAQVSADAGLTRTGDLLGTLRYMSPEQAAGRHLQVDPRSDVYSLGATMYELLTLQPVFDGTDRQSLLHQVLHNEPRAPRRIDRSIPIELETIVLKAVAKVPAERYPSAAEMAADLRRFLDERPVLARRPTAIDRARKWMRRHPTVVGAALVLLAFGVIGFAASTTLVLQEQDKTRKALNQEHARAIEAEQRFQLALRSANEMIRIANEDLSEDPGQQEARRRLLETAQIFYEEFIALRSGNPDAQAELELTREQLKKVLTDLSVMDVAWQHHLLREESVRSDLKLNTLQREKVNEVLLDIPAPPGGEPGEPRRSPNQRRRTLLQEVKEHEDAIREALSAEQLTRLRQIALQVRGADAFRQPNVAAELGLTGEQRDRIRTMTGDGGPGPRRGGPGPGHDHERDGPGRGGPKAMSAEDRQKAVDAILATLSPDQVTQWKALIGAPFQGAVAFPGPPGPRGPG